VNKKKIQIDVEEDDKEDERIPCGPEVFNPDFDLDLDIDDAIVQIIDGVLIEGDNEEIKLLFYHYKPDRFNEDDETIRCKGIAEFRTSRSTFNEIVKDFNGKIKMFKMNQGNIDDYLIGDTHPMMYS